jgi:uncharacterized repeat protein (TIGR01451 family)
MERLEDRTVLSVTLGANYTGMDFNASGGYTPPDTNGAVSNTTYVQTVNQTVALFNKASGSKTAQSSLSTFWFSTGGLPHADSGSGLSDPVVTFNNQIGRYIVGDQDVDFSTHVSRFDLAVSTSSDPATLSTSDWKFYSIATTQSGYDADFPGNFGYNADAFVVTLNMFPVVGSSYHVQVISVSNSDLKSGAQSPAVYKNNLSDFAVRPTVMHDSVAGDPMWLVTEHGDNASIDVIKMSNVLSSSPTFAYTNLSVNPYSNVLYPLNPNGTAITTNIDGRIQKSAEANNTIVACHTVAVSSNQDAIQWYAIDVSSGTPTLKDQGRVGSGSNTYSFYPAIDINANGQIGLTYMKSGNDSSSDYMSMYVTGRLPSDAAGTMETPVLVPAGTGVANYADFSGSGRAGDLGGISIDPSDGSFWAANEFANTEPNANWGTAIANFSLASPLPPADLAVSFTATPPSSIDVTNQAQTVTYTISFTNNGPNAASNVVLSDVLPAGATNVSVVQASGNDSFSINQSGGTFTATATSVPSGNTDTFTLTVTAPQTLSNGAAFNDSTSVTSNNPDPNTANNSATATSTIVNNNSLATLSVSVSGPTSGNEGGTFKYQITVQNTGSIAATSVVLTDTLASLLNYKSATTTVGTFSYSSGVVTFTIGTINAGSTVTATVTAQGVEDGSATNNVSATGSNVSTVTAGATTAINEPTISVSSPITRYGRTFTNLQTATFTHASGVEPTSAFAATINWGDGSTSAGTITFSSGTYRVTGSHTYTSQGNHTIKTTVVEVGSAPNSPAVEAGNKVDVSPARVPWWQRDMLQLPRWYRTHPRAYQRLLARLHNATNHHAAPASRVTVHTKPRHHS